MNKEKQTLVNKASEVEKALRSQGVSPSDYMRELLIKGGATEEQANTLTVKLTNPSTSPSEIVPTLNQFLLDQIVETNIISYLSTLPFPISFENVQNGVKEIVYQYNTDADTKTGTEDVVISQYNPEVLMPYAEIFKTRKAIHKEMRILDTVLNDVAKTPALFYAMVLQMAYKVSVPIERKLYQLCLQAIANPIGDFESSDEVSKEWDVSTIPADRTIDAKSLSDLAVQLNNLASELKVPSRSLIPARFKPAGWPADIPFEYNPNKGQILAIMPTELVNEYKINLQAGTFNIGEVQIPMDVSAVPYKNTFEEYGGVKGLAHDAAKGEYDVLIMQRGGIIGMKWYEGSKDIDTPSLFRAYHTYHRVGIAYNKHYLYLKVRVKVAKA